MGNEASTTMQAAEAKVQLDRTMKKIEASLDGTAKKDTDGFVGCKNRREANKRSKQRQAEYKNKQKERSERKSKLSQQWTEHRDQNAERPKRALFGNKRVKPRHWYDD